jgi:hypothetical protein
MPSRRSFTALAVAALAGCVSPDEPEMNDVIVYNDRKETVEGRIQITREATESVVLDSEFSIAPVEDEGYASFDEPIAYGGPHTVELTLSFGASVTHEWDVPSNDDGDHYEWQGLQVTIESDGFDFETLRSVSD